MSILKEIHNKGLKGLHINDELKWAFWDLLFNRRTDSVSKQIIRTVAMRVGDNPTGHDFNKEQVSEIIKDMIERSNSLPELVHSDAVRAATRICLERALHLDHPEEIFDKIVEHFSNLPKEQDDD